MAVEYLGDSGRTNVAVECTSRETRVQIVVSFAQKGHRCPLLLRSQRACQI